MNLKAEMIWFTFVSTPEYGMMKEHSNNNNYWQPPYSKFTSLNTTGHIFELTLYLTSGIFPKFILSCSKKMKVNTVWGPNRTKAGM